ncbi:MAG: DUF7322 domain-containing protein [Halodesulfurarchaeum sp.]
MNRDPFDLEQQMDEAAPGDELLANEVPRKLRREFLIQVGLVQVFVLAIGVGMLLVFFTSRARIGLLLIASGSLLGVLFYHRYRSAVPIERSA